MTPRLCCAPAVTQIASGYVVRRCNLHVHVDTGEQCPVEVAFKRVKVNDNENRNIEVWRAFHDSSVSHFTKPNPKYNVNFPTLSQERDVLRMANNGEKLSRAKVLWRKHAKHLLAQCDAAEETGGGDVDLSQMDIDRMRNDANRMLGQLNADSRGKVYFETMWANMKKKARKDAGHAAGTVRLTLTRHLAACTTML